MTERLYYHDSHLLEFDARITNISMHDEKHLAVTLDRTAFYPTSGGQPHDTGQLNEARVIDCVNESESEGTNVLHIVARDDANSLEVGARVNGRIDALRRFDHLQQHTAQHILSQAFVKLFNAETRGFRLFEQVAEIDIALDSPSPKKINQAVELANSIVWENRALHVIYATPEEANKLNLRKASGRAGVLRLVEIEDFDLTPCGGTHAHATGEIGGIFVRAWTRAKGMTRLEFVAGKRALNDYNRANETARSVAALFSVGRDEATNAVARLLDENKTLARRTRDLNETLARFEAAELIATSSTALSTAHDNLRLITRTFPNRDIESLNQLAHALVAHPATIALLATHDNKNEETHAARFVFARSKDINFDMGALMRETCAMIGGRGGGRPDFAQGGGQTNARQIKTILETLATKFT